MTTAISPTCADCREPINDPEGRVWYRKDEDARARVRYVPLCGACAGVRDAAKGAKQ